ncbi:MAG: hypothetical protein DDT20_01516 [Firmicutes bacterium]|nr:hypothetical protein [Bacillota bacterium]
MDIAPLNRYLSRSRIKSLELNSAYRTAIKRISKVRAKFSDVEFGRAPRNFFVRSKGNAQSPAFNLRIREQILHRRQNLRNASFVVCAKQRSAVCGNNVLSPVIYELGVVHRRHDEASLGMEHDVPTVIVLNYVWFYLS